MTIWSTPVRVAIALPRPMVEPPPRRHDAVRAACLESGQRRLGHLDRRVQAAARRRCRPTTRRASRQAPRPRSSGGRGQHQRSRCARSPSISAPVSAMVPWPKITRERRPGKTKGLTASCRGPSCRAGGRADCRASSSMASSAAISASRTSWRAARKHFDAQRRARLSHILGRLEERIERVSRDRHRRRRDRRAIRRATPPPAAAKRRRRGSR